MELRPTFGEPLRSVIGAEALAGLNPWAITGRYTADLPEGSGEVADRLIELASTVLDAVRDALPRRRRLTLGCHHHDRVGKALGLLSHGLAPFVARDAKAEYRDGWLQSVTRMDPASSPGG